ncbi:MAG: hypothetical protein MT490_08665 [Sphingomonas sp.]|uniref:hypothetical protein n=1 Tax=Sphingomonas sp. TaxID=28214 RepID=UPI0022766244|nr:hypothetical protein [Sphingomonas sp.]MCX8475853.1 hypothetical protein [Sphingomonas sp.]
MVLEPGSAPDNQHGSQDRDHDPRINNWLVIPYFQNDMGRPAVERPLPANVISWLCPSIVVNNQPGQNAFVRGQPTEVTVEVANFGRGTTAAPVYVRVWWADPCTAFSKLNPFGQTVVLAPCDGKARRSQSIIGIVPTWAPEHVCLLAHVSSPLDPGKTTPNPSSDRHWAQFNIAEVVASAGQPFQFFFNAFNPFTEAAAFEISVKPLGGVRMESLARLAKRPLRHAEELRVNLLQGRDEHGHFGREGDATELVLEPGRGTMIGITGMVPEGHGPGTSFALDIVQRQRRGEGFEGTLGLIVSVGGER